MGAGKTILITGATDGLGKGLAMELASGDGRLILHGRDQYKGQALIEELRPQATAELEWRPADLSSLDEVRDLAYDLQDEDRIDVLVNNAGMVSRASEWDLDPAEWDRLHAVNVRAVFFLSRAAARSMRERGAGSIINVSSIAGQHGGVAGSPAYASSKAAVIGITRSLARRFAPIGVRVNCIAPADIETDMTASWPPELRDRLNALTPLGRFGSVEEVAGAVTFLASNEASFITGQTLSINGGAYMG